MLFTLCSRSWLLSDLGRASSELFLWRLTSLLFCGMAAEPNIRSHIDITVFKADANYCRIRYFKEQNRTIKKLW